MRCDGGTWWLLLYLAMRIAMDMECLTVRVEHGVAPFWRPDVPVDWETANIQRV